MAPLRPGAGVPPEIVRALIRSGFLGADDSGRLVFLASKAIWGAVGAEEETWGALCRSRYPSTEKLPGDFVRERGWQRLFFDMERQDTPPEEHADPIPAPGISARDLVLMVDVYQERKGSIYSDAISGDRLPGLLQTGKSTIETPTSSAFVMYEHALMTDEDAITIRTKLLNLRNGKTLNITSNWYSEHAGQSTWIDGVWDTGFGTGVLRMREGASSILDRIAHKYDSLDADPHSHQMPYPRMDGIEIKVDVTLSTVGIAHSAHTDKSRHVSYPPEQQMVMKLSRIDLEVSKHCSIECIPRGLGQDEERTHPHWERKNFDSTLEAEVHGVTLLHLLENLDGWK